MAVVKLISNAGVLMEQDSARLLFDPFNTNIVQPYFGIPRDIFEDICTRGADAAIYTHMHPDHFDLSLTAEFMRRCTYAMLYVSTETVPRLKDAGVDMDRVHALSGRESFCVKDIRITAFPTRHLGPEYRYKEHYSYIAEGSKKALVTGDASPAITNFTDVDTGELDICVAPFPYAIGHVSARLFETALSVKKVFIVHLPDAFHDRDGMRRQVTLALSEKRPYELILPDAVGDVRNY